jgi:putative hemin receptor
VDGERVDNDANSYAKSKSTVNLYTLPSMDEIESIVLVKGSASAVYGADAAGGVLMITTRKVPSESKKPHSKTQLHTAFGSWGRRLASLSHSGVTDGGTLKYTVNVSREQSNDTKYMDSVTHSTQTYTNTKWHENHAAVSVEKKFPDGNKLTLRYRHASQQAYYPITAPDYRYMEKFYKGELAPKDRWDEERYRRGFGWRTPGYRNIFLYDAWFGSHDETRTNNISLRYTFGRTKEGAESYVHLYQNYTRYDMTDYSKLWDYRYPYFHKNWNYGKSRPTIHTDQEKVTGGTVQVAKEVGIHALTTGANYRESKYHYDEQGRAVQNVDRGMWNFYLQDKVHLTNRLTLTPGIIYTHYTDSTLKKRTAPAVNKFTASLFGNYDLGRDSNIYFSGSQIFRPATGLDMTREWEEDPLEDEKGWSLTAGINKRLSSKGLAGIHYADTHMSNAIAHYSILNPWWGIWEGHTVNARRSKRAMNLSYEHEFSPVWKAGVSYSWVNERFDSKRFHHNPDGTNVDDLINAFRPRNVYRMHLSYEKARWETELAYTIYSGNDTRYFTRSSFHVADLSVNYKFNKDMKVYLTVENLFNKAYETQASSIYSLGAFPEPGRRFTLGARCDF